MAKAKDKIWNITSSIFGVFFGAVGVMLLFFLFAMIAGFARFG